LIDAALTSPPPEEIDGAEDADVDDEDDEDDDEGTNV